jgi:hypothetical protein
MPSRLQELVVYIYDVLASRPGIAGNLYIETCSARSSPRRCSLVPAVPVPVLVLARVLRRVSSQPRKGDINYDRQVSQRRKSVSPRAMARAARRKVRGAFRPR